MSAMLPQDAIFELAGTCCAACCPGTLVRRALAQGCELAALSLAGCREGNGKFDRDVYKWLDVKRALARRDLVGAPARRQVVAEIRRIRKELSK